MSVSLLIGLLVVLPIAITIVWSVVRLVWAGILFLVQDYEREE